MKIFRHFKQESIIAIRPTPTKQVYNSPNNLELCVSVILLILLYQKTNEEARAMFPDLSFGLMTSLSFVFF